jgi:hypothetical protein
MKQKYHRRDAEIFLQKIPLGVFASPDLSFRRTPESRGGGPGQAWRENFLRVLRVLRGETTLCVSVVNYPIS